MSFECILLLFRFTIFSCRQNISRRYSYPLRDGHKAACLCVESTRYRYLDELDTPKKWFRANADAVLKQFGAEHCITKEDLFLSKQPHHTCITNLKLTYLVQSLVPWMRLTMLCLLVINIPVDRSAFITTIQNHSKLISLLTNRCISTYTRPLESVRTGALLQLILSCLRNWVGHLTMKKFPVIACLQTKCPR